MRTAPPGIYAAEDCIITHYRLLGETHLPLGTTAHKQGRVAGENALGGHREFAGSLGTHVFKRIDIITTAIFHTLTVEAISDLDLFCTPRLDSPWEAAGSASRPGLGRHTHVALGPNLRSVPENESVLFVPLRSNAKTLVTGAPIAALRRRLKYASVFHDQLFLESGVLQMQAGEGGSSSFVVPATEDRPARWQTPHQRQLAQQSPFRLLTGREITPGVPAETMHPVLASDSAISWTATLHPFAAELPGDTDWIHFGRFTEPGPGVRGIAEDWTRADERNPYLDEVIPGRFVRAAVIKSANNDLALAAAAGCTVTMDGLHSQIVVTAPNQRGMIPLLSVAFPDASALKRWFAASLHTPSSSIPRRPVRTARPAPSSTSPQTASSLETPRPRRENRA